MRVGPVNLAYSAPLTQRKPPAEKEFSIFRAPARGITKYRKVGEHTFRRIRPDGELAEVVTFDLGTDGKAIRLRTNFNFMPRISR